MQKLLAIYLIFTTQAVAAAAIVNDSDLSGRSGKGFAPHSLALELQAERTEFVAGGNGISVEAYREKNKSLLPVDGLSFRVVRAETDEEMDPVSCEPGARVDVRATLSTSRYTVTDGAGTYSVRARAQCGGVLKLIFDHDSAGGQALGIWQVAWLAEKKLGAETGLTFWQRKVTFVFPADGDYYSWDTVRISEGHHWDVVGHELGHALYDQADLGVSGGGPHAIDRCYTHALALSEGWATFFSGWLHLDPNDSDAKFEYLVPRLAPLPLEQIPLSVCVGQTNEWRVAAFFWDMYDSYDDGEGASESFSRMFQAMQGKMATNAGSAALMLMRSGAPLDKTDQAWELSFRQKR